MRGTERLAWAQAGDVSRLRFRAYVDGAAVDLTAATCNSGSPEAECSSPLPTLTNGVHTIAVVNVTASSGVESERTNSITVQKVTQRSIVAATLPMASTRQVQKIHLPHRPLEPNMLSYRRTTAR